MSSVELSDNKHLIHTIIGTEDTDKVLELCREMINDRDGDVFTPTGLYNYSNIADFLIAVEKVCSDVDIKLVYNTLEADIQKIALEIAKANGPIIESFIINNGKNRK